MRTCWRPLGPSWASLGALLGRSWGAHGTFLGALGSLLSSLGRSWGALGTLLGRSFYELSSPGHKLATHAKYHLRDLSSAIPSLCTPTGFSLRTSLSPYASHKSSQAHHRNVQRQRRSLLAASRHLNSNGTGSGGRFLLSPIMAILSLILAIMGFI